MQQINTYKECSMDVENTGLTHATCFENIHQNNSECGSWTEVYMVP